MNIRKQTLTLLTVALLLSVTARMKAQISIGADVDPQKFSLLELIGNNSNGLRLPQMNSTEIAALNSTISGLNATGKNNAKGLTVMNTTTNCMEIWMGSYWSKLCDPLILNASQTTAILYGYNENDPYNRGYGIDVEDQVDQNQANLSGLKISYERGLGKSLKEYNSVVVNGLRVKYMAQDLGNTGNIDLILSGTPTKRGAFDIPVVIDNQTVQVRIHVGCGMYVGDYSRADNYLSMMCINWGTSEFMDWSADPFNPSLGNNGDYFIWGLTDAYVSADRSMNYTIVHPSHAANFYNKGSEAAPVKDQANDPCPPGWRMPTRAELYSGLSEDATTNKCTSIGSWSIEKEVYGGQLRVAPACAPENFFTLSLPATGFMDTTNGTGWSSNNYHAVIGQIGIYRSSTYFGVISWGLIIAPDAPPRLINRVLDTDAFSLRCVTE